MFEKFTKMNNDNPDKSLINVSTEDLSQYDWFDGMDYESLKLATTTVSWASGSPK